MNPFEAQALREHAAAKTFDRLRGDRDRCSHRIRPLVAYVERHLFEPELNYERVRAACRIRDNNRTTLFRRELGLTPAAYIRDCRMEVACRLLRDTDLEVAWIAELVGYGGPQVFTPAFKRYAGVTPTWFRRRERPQAKAAAAQATLPATAVPDWSPSAWRRFVAGELGFEEASLLLRHFLDRYPELRRRLLGELVVRLRRGAAPLAGGDAWPDPAGDDGGGLVPSLREMLSREDVERLMAEAVWEEIQALPWNEQVDVVRHHLRFSTPAFLRLLGDRSREEGRADRQLGLRIARLALEHAPSLETAVCDDGTSSWRALAWAWIGNAKRLALDYDGAEKAFRAAARLLPESGTSPTAPAIAAELVMHEAMLRWDQRRLAEALHLVERAIQAFGDDGPSHLLSQAWMIRGLVRGDLGDTAGGVGDLRRVLERVVSGSDSYLRYGAHFNLARLHLQADDTTKAAAELEAARRALTPRLAAGTIEPIRVAWLEGLLASRRGEADAAAEKIFAVRDQLRDRDLVQLATMASLDLALLLANAGRLTAAAEQAADGLPLFDAVAGPRDAAIARHQLQQAIDTGLLTVGAAAQIRDVALRLARLDPALRPLPH